MFCRYCVHRPSRLEAVHRSPLPIRQVCFHHRQIDVKPNNWQNLQYHSPTKEPLARAHCEGVKRDYSGLMSFFVFTSQTDPHTKPSSRSIEIAYAPDETVLYGVFKTRKGWRHRDVFSPTMSMSCHIQYDLGIVSLSPWELVTDEKFRFPDVKNAFGPFVFKVSVEEGGMGLAFGDWNRRCCRNIKIFIYM